MLVKAAAERAIRRQAEQERQADEERLLEKFEEIQARAKEDLGRTRAREAERKKLEQQGLTRTEIMKREQEEVQQRIQADTEAKKKEVLEKMQRSAGTAEETHSVKPEPSADREESSDGTG